MASTPVEIQYTSGLTLTLELYPLGSDTIANGSGDTLTEETNRKGLYTATVTEALTGWHHAIVLHGSVPVSAGYVYLTDTTNVHRPEAAPWALYRGLEAPQVDLVDAPNATAIEAIQDGLSTFDPETDAVTVEAIEEDAIDAEAIAADAVAAVQSGLATASALQVVDDNVDAIKAVTDNLPDSGALTSLTAKTDLPANFADLSITATTGRVEIETNHDKTGYALTSDYDAAKTAAKAGDEMALTTGALAAVNAAADQALADYDPPTRAEATADKDEILGAIEAVDGVADAILDAVETDGVAITSTTMQAIADALLDRANAIDGATPRAALRYIAAMLAGKVTGAGTGVETFYGLDGTTPRLEITVDTDGNRSAVEYDPA